MQPLPLAVLEHTAPRGRHYDLLILDPTTNPTATHRMWAARVAVCPRDWRRVVRLDLILLPHHRAHYLTYQGPVSGGRGRVVRVDAGAAVSGLWTPRRISLDVRMRGYTGRLELRQHHACLWRVQVAG